MYKKRTIKVWFIVTNTNCVALGLFSATWILTGLGCPIAGRQATLRYSTRDTLSHGRVKRKRLVALLTTEAEMIAVVKSVREQKAVCKLFGKSSRIATESWAVYCENQPVIQLPHDSGYTGHTKHIDLRFPAIQDVITRRDIDLKYCPSGEKWADILAKYLLPQTHAEETSLLDLAAPGW